MKILSLLTGACVLAFHLVGYEYGPYHDAKSILTMIEKKDHKDPMGLAVTDDGLIISANTNGNEVAIFDFLGCQIPGIPSIYIKHPTSVVVTPPDTFRHWDGDSWEHYRILVANKEGEIYAFNLGMVLPVKVANMKGSSFMGMTFAEVETKRGKKEWHLFLADFAQNRVVELSSEFKEIATKKFVIKDLPKNLSPLNVAYLLDHDFTNVFYVVYATKDKEGNVDKKGNGLVAQFDLKGGPIQIFVMDEGLLKVPYGVAVVSPEFSGRVNSAVAISDHQTNRIHLFSIRSGRYIGPLHRPNGMQIELNGIWGLHFYKDWLLFNAGGPDGNNGKTGIIEKLVKIREEQPKQTKVEKKEEKKVEKKEKVVEDLWGSEEEQ